MATAYDEDLAYIHDVGFGDFARQAAPGLLKWMRSRGFAAGRVIDLGCGSGIWAEALAAAGYDVLGVDLSPAMITMARKRVPSGEFQVASFLDVDFPACTAVTAMGEVLNYLFDPRNRLAALKRLFRRVHRALEPGGLFIFDVAGPQRQRGVSQNFVDGGDWTVLVEYERDPERERLTRRIISFRQRGESFRRSDEIHRLQLYRPRELSSVLREAGFRVRLTRSYGAFPLLPGTFGVVARKA